MKKGLKLLAIGAGISASIAGLFAGAKKCKVLLDEHNAEVYSFPELKMGFMQGEYKIKRKGETMCYSYDNINDDVIVHYKDKEESISKEELLAIVFSDTLNEKTWIKC